MKTSIFGVGKVGAAVGLALAARHLVDELVLIGRDSSRTHAEAADLRHATAFGRPTNVYAGDVAAAAGSDVIILCLNAGPRHGTFAGRDADFLHNARAFADLIPAIAAASPAAVLVVATNPVDAMTTLAGNLSGFPPGRVIGTGTLLDTMRLRSLLSERLRIHAQDIRAYVLGEHGDRQFVAFASATVGGGPLHLSRDEAIRLEEEVRRAGHDIAGVKGYTNSGIALCVAEIVDTIVHDLHQVMPLSVRLDGFCGVTNVCLSVPVVLGRAGVLQQLEVVLSPDETEAFVNSAASIGRLMQSCRDAGGTANGQT